MENNLDRANGMVDHLICMRAGKQFQQIWQTIHDLKEHQDG